MKQFSGASVDEVLLKVRAELGEDAVILQTKRVVNGGIGGFFGRQGVEVTAAEGLPPEETEAANREAAASVAPPREEEPPAEPPAAPPAEAPARADNPFHRHLEGRLAAAEEAEAMDIAAPVAPASPAAAYARNAAPAPRPFAAGDLERSQAILEAARTAVRQARASSAPDPLLAAAPEAPAPAPPPQEDFVPSTYAAAPEPAPRVPAALAPVAPRPVDRRLPGLDAVRDELVRAGVDERTLDGLLEGFARGVAPFLGDGDPVRDAVRDHIAAGLPVVREWEPAGSGRTLALVGQTGVGKTSAAACLAGRFRAAGLTAALVAAGDGPHDALEGHARRLDVQLFRAADGAALATLCGTLADRDLVVIDTAGRSHQRPGEVEDLSALLGPAGVAEVHLVMPAAVAPADLEDVERRFRLAGVNRLTLTKLDETRFHGNLLNLPMRMGNPLAFLSSSTSVPDALAPARGRRVAEMLLP